MNYGIIAAGEGSRLSAEGVKLPKPLVLVNGEHLIDRLIRVFMDNDAENITIICNEQMTEVRKHLEDISLNGLQGRDIPMTVVVKNTPSSMHSFFEISENFNNGAFCITTVDTIFKQEEFKKYISLLMREIEVSTIEQASKVNGDSVNDTSDIIMELILKKYEMLEDINEFDYKASMRDMINHGVYVP